MQFSTIIGSLGVSFLLIAFFINLFGFVKTGSRVYILLNVVGAGISCYASILIKYMPFIILEGIWCLVGLAALFKRKSTS